MYLSKSGRIVQPCLSPTVRIQLALPLTDLRALIAVILDGWYEHRMTSGIVTHNPGLNLINHSRPGTGYAKYGQSESPPSCPLNRQESQVHGGLEEDILKRPYDFIQKHRYHSGNRIIVGNSKE